MLRLLREAAPLQGLLDFILVDEGQDLSGEAYEILRLAARHITVFIDPLQKIFEDGAPEAQILETLGIPRRNATLLFGTGIHPVRGACLLFHRRPGTARAVFVAMPHRTAAQGKASVL